ncbi:hypothetical protein COL23_26245 [Priestia aryabhattai]|uniref:DUF3885 domain-containing protein n=1 Tax=Priestia aryabhattai TaxID=412384 RepID=UPI000BF49D9D|nr:DUF3885 domain-containing protein [Priestia aryabhattai]PFW72000.1 hypothetical protein COL23_26245 [Priestia aryabhattai]
MSTNTLPSFLENYFEGLTLSPALFYSWKYSIRFEISDPLISYYEKDCLKQAFHRSITLFHKVFEEEDEILFVTDVHTMNKDLFLQKRPLNVYLKYIKDKKRLYQLNHHRLPSVFQDEDEDDQSLTHRFVLSCKKTELRYVQLLQAINYEGFAHPSTIMKSNPQSGYDIYFINLSKKMIFHLYDDRGCDILASNKEPIRFLYEEYNNWILDYNREEIDLLFT